MKLLKWLFGDAEQMTERGSEYRDAYLAAHAGDEGYFTRERVEHDRDERQGKERDHGTERPDAARED
jgi:hypothetical protein